MKQILVIFLLIISSHLFSITLEECIDYFNNNNQLPQKIDLWQKSSEDIKTLSRKEWLPKLSLNGSFMWSANTMELGLQAVEQDKTQLELILQQPIYTANTISLKREGELLNNAIQQNLLEDAILMSKKIIYGLYFNVLILEQKMQITTLSLDHLHETADYIKIKLDSGKTSHLDSLIIANLIITQQENLQNLTQIKQESITQLIEVLDSNIIDGSEFSYPSDITIAHNKISRNELLRFSLMEEVYQNQQQLNNTSYFPKVNAFVKGNYGNPNYNLYQNEWAENMEVGITLNWNFWNWGIERNKNNKLNKQIKINQLSREEFLTQVNTELIKIVSNIEQIDNSLNSKDTQLKISNEITLIFEESYKLGKSDVLTYSEKLMENQQLQESIALLQLEKLYQKYLYNLISGEL